MIRVVHPGIYASVQDAGRFGYRDIGVPLSGAMDRFAMQCANELLGNDETCAVLEITGSGAVFVFESKTYIGFCGAAFEVKLNGEKIRQNEVVPIEKGSEIRFDSVNTGMWGYLAVYGGIMTDLVLGSRSMYRGITKSTRLNKGDLIPIRQAAETMLFPKSKPYALPSVSIPSEISVGKGPEFSKLSEIQVIDLLSETFTISTQSNRMAYLMNEKLSSGPEQIITAPVQPGTVQLTPSGQLIILMRDAQTTGGYARVLQLEEPMINFLAQHRATSQLRFKLN